MANLFRCAGAGGEDIKCIERPYNSNDIYNTGDTAMYNGLLRICTADGVTGEFDVSKWEVTTLDELLGENIGENDALVDYIASEYDPTHTYMTGDAILGDNAEILKCLEDEVTGEFDNSKWSRDYLCNLSGNVNSNLTKIYEVSCQQSFAWSITSYTYDCTHIPNYEKLSEDNFMMGNVGKAFNKSFADSYVSSYGSNVGSIIYNASTGILTYRVRSMGINVEGHVGMFFEYFETIKVIV